MPNMPYPTWLLCLCLGLSATHTHGKEALPVPQQLRLVANLDNQQLSVAWLGGTATMFDLMIRRTELNVTVFYDTVRVDPVDGGHQWNWTSVPPLQCTSLSVQLRSREGEATSEWSSEQKLQGEDGPNSTAAQMFPQDKVVAVGANTTFCCIFEENMQLGSIMYKNTLMNLTKISNRSYVTTKANQEPSGVTGTNVFCSILRTMLAGTVVFVGYPPLPSDLLCETHDLATAVCHWNKGRDTHLYGIKRGTYYTLNGRNCTEVKQTRRATKQEVCSGAHWDGNWTLVAQNPLGQYILTDSAELRNRVRPVAPSNLTSVSHAWTASLLWEWKYNSYKSLALICQVELTSNRGTTMRKFPGVGLRSLVLSDLHPDEEYSIRVRCGAQQNLWKWGDWSNPLAFRTLIDIPDALDMWVSRQGENTMLILWKPLTHRASHGQITGYELTLWSPEENVRHTQILPLGTHSVPVNVTHVAGPSRSRVIATVTARNGAGVSPPASVILPQPMEDVERPLLSKAAYVEGGFALSWQSSPNASCGYVVEWQDASCLQDCSVDWVKVTAEANNVSVQSGDFQPGTRYILSLYSCSTEAPELLLRWQGYTHELVPSASVLHLLTSQQSSDILLSWDETPLVHQRGFTLGYHIYLNNGYQLTLLANLSEPSSRNYTVKGLSAGSYKFTVKAYNSAGEDSGATASISLEPYTDWLILEILAFLGMVTCFLVLITFICYKKRTWVKRAFYPDIPEPKVAGDWSRPQGPLDVKPSPHCMVQIVEEPEWDFSKEALVVIPEEEEDDLGQGPGSDPADTDEPASLRYYNQVVDERPIRPRYPDTSGSSASSLDSGCTDVTYTGIQTSGSSLAFQLQPQGPSQAEHPVGSEGGGGGGGGYRPQMQPAATGQSLGPAAPQPFPELPAASGGSFGGSFGGYKPQSSWHLDSPVEAGQSRDRAPSLGSPTSITSTHFLLSDGESEERSEGKGQSSSSATAWFHNLLASSKA